MGRKTQVTREQMLEAGLKIIIRDGFNAVSIKSVAAEIGCSTTPIAWGFDTIENYRNELRLYAFEYLKNKLSDGKKPPFSYRRISELYIDLALEAPNLLLCMRADKEMMELLMSNHSVFEGLDCAAFCRKWTEEIGCPTEKTLGYIKFLATYSEGIISLLLSGDKSIDKETAYKMLDEAEAAYSAYIGCKKAEH